MIYVNRESLDENGAPIRPTEAWFEAAKVATETAIEEKSNHEFKEQLYKHYTVRSALEKLFHDKCAYCEWKPIGGSDSDVEHFRPKGRVAEREDHPGYYWLAYEWCNLYLSCAHCNQKRKDKPRWGDPTELPAGGKLDQFPLCDELTRVMSDDDNGHLLDEKTLLIDPCSSAPDKYLGYDLTGQVFALEGNAYGEATIRVFNLTRRRLRALRRDKVEVTVGILKLIRKFDSEGMTSVANEIRPLLSGHESDSSEFAAVTRYIVQHPDSFKTSPNNKQ